MVAKIVDSVAVFGKPKTEKRKNRAVLFRTSLTKSTDESIWAWSMVSWKNLFEIGDFVGKSFH